MTKETFDCPLEPLAQHVLTLAMEEPKAHWDVYVPDDCEWDIEKTEWESVEVFKGPTTFNKGNGDPKEDETWLAFHGLTIGTTWYQTLKARYNPPGKAHPAEYDVEEHELLVTIEFYPERHFGECRINVESY